MPIYAPGKRHRRHKKSLKTSRKVLAVLSLTAMVDMFTVLVVFLLQNYNVTGQVIHIPKDVQLPKATTVKELKPAHIVSISDNFILVDDKKIARLVQLREEDWLIRPLHDYLKKAFEMDRAKASKGIQSKIRTAVMEAKRGAVSDEEEWRKVTVQADKKITFSVIKKVMYTLVEAGAGEVNFAVERRNKEKDGVQVN